MLFHVTFLAVRETQALVRTGRGVLLLYPAREDENKQVSIGFEILLPPNNLPYGIQYTTRVQEDVATIEADDSA